ncbi:unnamed protein product, partial [Heterosigma akashiwo]
MPALSPLVQLQLLIQGFNALAPEGRARQANLYFSQSYFLHAVVTQGLDEFYQSLEKEGGILRHIQADLRHRGDSHVLYSCLAAFETDLNAAAAG